MKWQRPSAMSGGRHPISIHQLPFSLAHLQGRPGLGVFVGVGTVVGVDVDVAVSVGVGVAVGPIVGVMVGGIGVRVGAGIKQCSVSSFSTISGVQVGFGICVAVGASIAVLNPTAMITRATTTVASDSGSGRVEPRGRGAGFGWRAAFDIGQSPSQAIRRDDQRLFIGRRASKLA